MVGSFVRRIALPGSSDRRVLKPENDQRVVGLSAERNARAFGASGCPEKAAPCNIPRAVASALVQPPSAAAR
eukprot:5864094-Pyramimonas_sp.AAC.1